MKKFKLFALGLLGATLLLTSCEDDEDTALGPVLTVTEVTTGTNGGNMTVAPGSDLSFVLRADRGDADLDVFKVNTTGGEWPSPLPASQKGFSFPFDIDNANDETYLDTLKLTIGQNESLNSITFSVTDKDGLSEQVTFDVTIENAETPLANEVTGAFFHIGGSLEGAYDLVNETVVAASDPDNTKDMINTDMAGGTFTGSWEAGSGTNTSFVQDNSFDYNNATVENATAAFQTGTSTTSISNPAVGDIYLVHLRGNDYAAVKITEVDPTNNECGCGNVGKITFSYKKR